MTGTFQPTSFLDKCCLFALLIVLQQGADAEPLIALEFESLEHDSLQLQQVSMQLDHEQGKHYQLRLRAARARLPSGQTVNNVDVECRTALGMPVMDCIDGRIRLTDDEFGEISGRLAFEYDIEQGVLQQARLEQLKLAGAIMNVSLKGPSPSWQLQAEIKGLDLDSARSFAELAGFLGAVETLEGEISGTIHASGWPLETVTADLTLNNVNYAADSVAQALSGKAHVSLEHDNNYWQGEISLAAAAGELYIVPPLTTLESRPGFYIAIGDEPVTLDAVFAYDEANAGLVIQNLDYVHPDVMQMNLSGRIQFAPVFNLEGLSLRIPETFMKKAYPVYVQPWLIATPYSDLNVIGRASMELGIGNGIIGAVSLQLDRIDIVDKQERFAIHNLSTDVQMTENRRHASRLSWDSLDIYRIGLGAGVIELVSQDLNIAVTRWQDVPLMDGTLRISELDLRKVGMPEFELHMAGSIESVSLPVLTKAIGWPALGGTLDGEFGGLTYTDGDIRMDGELQVRMFDGEVNIRDLEVSDLFGSLPVLTADIRVRDIDLEQLTDTFAFGKITGRLSGYIRDLRLENWQPVAFDAMLSTLGDDSRHRISQKALNNLTQIGGGLSGALSRGFLAYFDEYSYGELGLSCRLANGFCELGGVEAYNEGHYLLTRGGLLPPWVEVKLAGSIIGWDALIEGFEQIAQSEVKTN